MLSMDRQKGFSLVELMVVLVIIGILGAIAYPNYEQFLRSGHRADAMAQLVELTVEMEQYKAANNTYAGAAIGGGSIGTPNPNLIMSLDEAVTRYYDVTIMAADRNSYMLRAVPIGNQAADVCGTITIGLNGDFNYALGAPSSCEK